MVQSEEKSVLIATVMAHTPLKSFSISSLLPETALEHPRSPNPSQPLQRPFPSMKLVNVNRTWT